MNSIFKSVLIGSLITVATATSVLAQETSLLTRSSFNDGATTIDDLNIDAEITIEGGVYMQRSAVGNIATITIADLNAASAAINQRVRIQGDTSLGEEASLSEANIHLTGDMGAVAINHNYQREGKVQLSHQSSLNLGNVVVMR